MLNDNICSSQKTTVWHQMKHSDYLSYIYDIDNISLFLFILEIISPVIMLYGRRTVILRDIVFSGHNGFDSSRWVNDNRCSRCLNCYFHVRYTVFCTYYRCSLLRLKHVTLTTFLSLYHSVYLVLVCFMQKQSGCVSVILVKMTSHRN